MICILDALNYSIITLELHANSTAKDTNLLAPHGVDM